MKSNSLWPLLDEVVALTRVFVLKWNSFGTVVDRTIFFGGGSKTVNVILKCVRQIQTPNVRSFQM